MQCLVHHTVKRIEIRCSCNSSYGVSVRHCYFDQNNIGNISYWSAWNDNKYKYVSKANVSRISMKLTTIYWSLLERRIIELIKALQKILSHVLEYHMVFKWENCVWIEFFLFKRNFHEKIHNSYQFNIFGFCLQQIKTTTNNLRIFSNSSGVIAHVQGERITRVMIVMTQQTIAKPHLSKPTKHIRLNSIFISYHPTSQFNVYTHSPCRMVVPIF